MTVTASKSRPVVHGLKALAGAQAALPPRRVVELAGGPVEYVKAGDGERTVVLLGGAGTPIEVWALVAPQLAQRDTVLAFNERGTGASAAPQRPQTGTVIVEMLRELLGAVGLAPPYVLVAHGFAGLHANLFARSFPDEVAAVVLLESAHPDDRVDDARLRFLPKSLMPGGGGKGRRRHDAIHFIAETAVEIAQAGPFPDLPLTVVSGTRKPPRWTTSPQQVRTRSARQRELVTLSAIGTHTVAPASGRFPPVTDPEIVVRAVREVGT